ncbi:MAG: pitrilysin family protein [Candidatus Omnitrophica bacterium]|nr:pitrilysin family protein [Candidatus Omnitrophota bacterium]MDD5351990.1 pitrilysin family protein [Candidatus Omnitrophota bacterium]MDD5551044.1 pitrilysin family protein [Candidatus Omnitrophota bacterium]
MYKKTVLKNNLTLVTHQMSDAFSVSVGVWLKVGSRYENDPLAGISHFLEHLLFKGSQKYDNYTIKSQIEGRGGLLNGFTSEELTCYLAKVPHKIAYSTFEILLDMALHPLLKQEDIQREKTVIIEEIKMYNDLPQHIVHELLDKTMWPGHPLGRNIAGTIESVNSISRGDLLNFQDKYYCADNMVIVFAGNIKHKDCLDFVSRKLGKAGIKNKDYFFKNFYSQQKEAQIKTQVKDTEQTRLAIGFPSYDRSHPKRFMETLLSIILGGNMSSRLFNEIREKHGLAYEISSQCKLLRDTGAFYISAGLDNKKVDLALNLILKELARLKEKPVSQEELTRAKEYFLSQVAMSLEDTLDHMLFLGEAASATGELLDFSQIKKKVSSIRPADLKCVAGEIFTKDKINISLVGPVKDFNKDGCFKHIDTALV